MVIQRWQSVLLLAASVVMGCFTFCSLGQITTDLYTFDFTTYGLTYEGVATEGAPSGSFLHTWYLFALSLMSAIIPFIAIFCFKNFALQKRLCLIEILFLVATSACCALIGYNAVEGSTIGWSTLICAPLIALCADLLAYRRIRNDENLIKSASRFR